MSVYSEKLSDIPLFPSRMCGRREEVRDQAFPCTGQQTLAQGPKAAPLPPVSGRTFYAQQTCSFIPAFSTAACMGQPQNGAVTGSPWPTKPEMLPYLDLYRKKICQTLVP